MTAFFSTHVLRSCLSAGRFGIEEEPIRARCQGHVEVLRARPTQAADEDPTGAGDGVLRPPIGGHAFHERAESVRGAEAEAAAQRPSATGHGAPRATPHRNRTRVAQAEGPRLFHEGLERHASRRAEQREEEKESHGGRAG